LEVKIQQQKEGWRRRFVVKDESVSILGVVVALWRCRRESIWRCGGVGVEGDHQMVTTN